MDGARAVATDDGARGKLIYSFSGRGQHFSRRTGKRNFLGRARCADRSAMGMGQAGSGAYPDVSREDFSGLVISVAY